MAGVPDAARPLLAIERLSIRFGATQPVDSVDLAVAQGEVLGLVGESGSGKSLTLRAILGLLPRHAAIGGRIIWQGTDLLTMAESELNAAVPKSPRQAMRSATVSRPVISRSWRIMSW